MTLWEFVRQNRHADVTELALRMRKYPEMDASFVLQQVEGLQRAEHKLPELAGIEGWLWPARLSVEQCSSEVTAKYKKKVLSLAREKPENTLPYKEPANPVLNKEQTTPVSNNDTASSTLKKESESTALIGELIDLTGGMGVDTYYLSALFRETYYVEQQEELCRLAEHNFHLTGKSVRVCHAKAEEWLGSHTNDPADTVIFLDPARRDKSGGKVFRLQDCTPDVIQLLSLLRTHARTILLKLSPMLDITEAVRALGGAAEVHIVAVRNEVKELLLLLQDGRNSLDPLIVCRNLETDEAPFVFRRTENLARDNKMSSGTGPTTKSTGEELLLVLPNAAIQKAGGYNLFGLRYGLQPLDANSHLYILPMTGNCCAENNVSETGNVCAGGMERVSTPLEKRLTFFAPDDGGTDLLPGRVFRVHVAEKDELKNLQQANIICRNYPMSPDDLKKKFRLKDGGEKYLIATKMGGKLIIFVGVRQFLHI